MQGGTLITKWDKSDMFIMHQKQREKETVKKMGALFALISMFRNTRYLSKDEYPYKRELVKIIILSSLALGA